MTYDPPCWYTGDHQWHGASMCPSCGARLRCECGRFVREDAIDAHMETCRVVAAHVIDESGDRPEHWLKDGEPSGPDNEWPGDPENIPSRIREAGREFRERVR